MKRDVVGELEGSRLYGAFKLGKEFELYSD